MNTELKTLLVLAFGIALYVYIRFPFAMTRLASASTREARRVRELERMAGGTLTYEQLETYWDGTVKTQWRRYMIHATTGRDLRYHLDRLRTPGVRNVFVVDFGGASRL